MAIIQHFTLDLVRIPKERTKQSLKLRRKVTDWTPDYLDDLFDVEAV